MKRFSYILFAAAIAWNAVSCYDPHTEHMEDFMSRVYFRDGGETMMTVYRTGEDTYYPVSVCKGGFDQTRPASVRVQSMTPAQMHAYNIQNETDFELIPSDLYTFVNYEETATLSEPVTLDFSSEDLFRIVKLRVNTNDLSNLLSTQADKNYVFGLILYSEETVSDEINLMLLSPDIAIPVLSLANTGGDKVILNNDETITKTYNGTLRLAIDENRFDFDCTLGIMDQEWLDRYNAENGTEYHLAPQSCYRTTLPKVHFDEKTTDVLFSLKFDLNRSGIDPFTDYVIPVGVTSCTKTEYEIGPECVYLVPLRSEPPMEKVALDADMVSVSHSHNGDGEGAPALVDGVTTTYWHSPYSTQTPASTDATYGYYIDIALNSPLRAFQLTYWIRHNNNNGRPRRIVFGVSTDGQFWTEAGTLASDNMNMAAGAKVELSSILAPFSFSYLRIGIAQAGDGPYELRGAPQASTALAEIELYGTAN